MPTRRTTIALIVLLLLLLIVTDCKRKFTKGGRSKSDRAPRTPLKGTPSDKVAREGKSVDGRYGNIGEDKTTCIVNKDGKKECHRGERNSLGNMLIIMLFVVIGGTACVCPLICRDVYNESGMGDYQSDKTMNQALQIYVRDHINVPSTLKLQVRQKMLSSFVYHYNMMIIRPNSERQRIYCKLKLLDLKKKTDLYYRIKMEGVDKLGKSIIQGIILFTGQQMGVKFSKVYNYRMGRGEDAQYAGAFFEGTGFPECIRGSWAIFGYRNSPNYSGDWEIYAT